MSILKCITIFFAFFLFFEFSPVFSQILILKQEEGKELSALTDEDQEHYLGALPVSTKKEKREEEQEITMPEIPQPDCKTIFGILHMYQWPSSILFTSKMGLDEKRALFAPEVDAEIKFIQKKIKENIDPKYVAVYIPNIVYELFFIYFSTIDYQKGKINKLIDEFAKNSCILEPRFNATIGHYLNKILVVFAKANEDTKKMHFFLNKKFGTYYLATKQRYLQEQREENFFSFMSADLIAKRSWYEHELALKTKYPKLDVQKSIAKVLALEEEAQKTNNALIFRCSKPFKFTKNFDEKNKEFIEIFDSSLKIDHQIKNYSLSYSNTLFSGWNFDRDAKIGACTYTLSSKENYCYALTIEKAAYIKKILRNNYNNLFTIAPLMSLGAILGKGEIVHSRSKIALNEFSNESILVEGYGWLLTPSRDLSRYLFIQQDRLTHAYKFSHFLGDNIKLVKGPDADKRPLAEQEQALRKGQHDAALVYITIKYGLKISERLKKIRAKKVHKAEAAFAASQEALSQDADDASFSEPLGKKAKISVE